MVNFAIVSNIFNKTKYSCLFIALFYGFPYDKVGRS